MSFSVMMENKQRSINQTAAKIKTKIHNTSSFFKLSLKTNNKALALALAAQKQKTRQIEADAVRLQKDVQSLNFDLAIQRHKNKQMFAILREFYNSSINCMAKAVDLISNEEGAEIMDTESSRDACQADKNLTGLLPELRSRKSISKSVPQENTQTSSVNVPVMEHCQRCDSSIKSKEHCHCSEIDHTAPPNTLDELEMEITMVDSAAQIVTVQTKPIINHDDDQQSFETNKLSLSRKGERSMSSSHEATVESSNLNNVTLIGFTETPSDRQHLTTKSASTITCSNEEHPTGPLHGGEESLNAQRKTYVTSRIPKNKRSNIQKPPAENPDGIIPSHSDGLSNTDDTDDFFSDKQLQNQRKSKNISCDGHISKYKGTESEKNGQETQNEGVNLRETFVIPPKPRPKQSRKSKKSIPCKEQKLTLNENLDSTDVAAMDLVTDVMEMSANTKHRWSKWSTHKEHNVVKRRGTYVIHTNQSSDCSDILNDKICQVDSREIANTAALDCNQESYSNNYLTIEQLRVEQDDSHMLENRPYLKHSINANDNLSEQISELSSLGHTKPKKAKLEMVKKARKKNITTTKSATGNKHQQDSSTLATKTPPSSVKKIDSSTNALKPAAEDLHSVGTDEALTREFYQDRGCKINVQSRRLDHRDDLGTSCHLDVNKKDGPCCTNIQNPKSKSRQTYVVLSGSSLPVNVKEHTLVFNSSPDESLLTNDKENSLVGDRNPLFPHHSKDNQSTPRRLDQVMQQQKELLGEERPPWESLSFESSMSLACDSPVSLQRVSCDSPQRNSRDISSRTVDIYEESGLSMTHKSPDARPMKSLTNTDLTANAPGRSRRKAAPMSFKEPPLNCKMRRGDKFSDTRFLSSPLFKDQRKKHSKKKNKPLGDSK